MTTPSQSATATPWRRSGSTSASSASISTARSTAGKSHGSAQKRESVPKQGAFPFYFNRVQYPGLSGRLHHTFSGFRHCSRLPDIPYALHRGSSFMEFPFTAASESQRKITRTEYRNPNHQRYIDNGRRRAVWCARKRISDSLFPEP